MSGSDYCDNCIEDDVAPELCVCEPGPILSITGNYVTYAFLCPTCGHAWTASFYED